MKVEPATRLEGTGYLPGDKSISHRYAILGAMAKGTTRISNYSASADCTSTLSCIRSLGAMLTPGGNDQIRIDSPGWRDFVRPLQTLDAGNSGTALRLLTGCLAASDFTCQIDGDASLRQRPMARIVEPLRAMGAEIMMSAEGTPPLRIQGRRLSGIEYTLPVASAQVKTCLLLAGLMSDGRTRIIEPLQTRDHTERAFPLFGADIQIEPGAVGVTGGQSLNGATVRVPGDFSGAAYVIAAALIVHGARVVLQGVGLNPTRTALLNLLLEAGADIAVDQATQEGEPTGNLTIRWTRTAFQNFPSLVAGAQIPNLIDEIPILAVLATQTATGLAVREAKELRKKESDRITAVVDNLRRIGVEVEEFEDGFQVSPCRSIRGGRVQTHGDHRIAMAFAVAGLISSEGVELDDPGCAAISFPEFFDTLERLQRAP